MGLGSTKLAKSVRGVGRTLRWWLTAHVTPAARRVPPPPWPLAPASALGQVVARHVSPSEPIIPPQVYGRVSPPANLLALPRETGQLSVGLTRCEDIVLLGRDKFISRATGGVLPQSFLSLPDWDAETPGAPMRGLIPAPRLGRQVEHTDQPLFSADARWHHFGHTFLEVVPRLMLAADAPPEVQIVTSQKLTRGLMMMGEMLGIDPARWRRVYYPLHCNVAYLPDMPLQVGTYPHPLAREAFRRIGELGRQSDISDRPERIFLSRARIDRRKLAEEAAVEALFAGLGFAVIHPETLPFETQIALMQGARLVAGLGGSAMHLAVFAPPQARVLMVSMRDWFASIDVHLHPATGRLGYVFGDAESGHPAVRARWTVDVNCVEQAAQEHFDI